MDISETFREGKGEMLREIVRIKSELAWPYTRWTGPRCSSCAHVGKMPLGPPTYIVVGQGVVVSSHCASCAERYFGVKPKPPQGHASGHQNDP